MNEALKTFVFNIEELGELLQKPNPSMTVGAANPKNNKINDKSVAKDIFIEFRKLLFEKGQSYEFIIEQLKKSTLADDKKQWLDGIPACAQDINSSNYSGVLFGDNDDENLNNLDAFLELQSTYITHTDRMRSPLKKLIPTDVPDYQHYYFYLTQVVKMAQTYYDSFLYYMKEFCEEVIASENL